MKKGKDSTSSARHLSGSEKAWCTLQISSHLGQRLKGTIPRKAVPRTPCVASCFFFPLPLFRVAYLCLYQLLCAGAKTWKPACSHPYLPLLDSNFPNALSINLACSSEQAEQQWYCGWSELPRAPGEESTCFRLMCFLQILALAGLARALVVFLVTADDWMVMLTDWPERMRSPLKRVQCCPWLLVKRSFPAFHS